MEGPAVSLPAATKAQSVHPDNKSRNRNPSTPCHPDRSVAKWRDLLCASPHNNPLSNFHRPTQLCHPDRSEAKWRDLRFHSRLQQTLEPHWGGGPVAGVAGGSAPSSDAGSDPASDFGAAAFAALGFVTAGLAVPAEPSSPGTAVPAVAVPTCLTIFAFASAAGLLAAGADSAWITCVAAYFGSTTPCPGVNTLAGCIDSGLK